MEFADNELTIEPVNDELVDLETLILEGEDSLIPLKFVYPNTDRKTGVYMKPLTGKEFKNVNVNKINAITLITGCLFDMNKEALPGNVIEKLPAGVILELYRKLCEISGIELDEERFANF